MNAGLPLLRDSGDAVARRAGALIPRSRLLAEIGALAAQLPDRPYVVNFCNDRYRFTVAWAAAMLRGQVTLLPGSRDTAAVTALQADYPDLYVLADDAVDNISALQFSYPTLAGASPVNTIPAFPRDQVAAVLFTSGSTGRPQPSIRRWGRLVAGSLAAGSVLGLARYKGSPLVATVPHAHSYGLESAIMLPLQHGLLLTSERPFFPADIAAAMGEAEGGILVTTPVHLRALVGDSTPREPSSLVIPNMRPGFVLSATAPLPTELAARGEAAFNAPVFEIYGCSEAGQVAARRTVEGPVWGCLQGFRLRQDAAGTWVSGPDEDDVLLADEIELVGAQTFILQGRTADMVNVAGKRSSLGYLTRQLTAIEGVKDGVFLMPGDDAAGAPARLIAVVVAPGLDAATILRALRDRIDPAFLPRPLHVVDALPRNALGKLPRSEILRLIDRDAAGGRPEPVLLHLPADHPAGPGHFPGNPIIPGAGLLDELVGKIFPAGWSGQIDSAKFHHPVRPGDTVAVTHTTNRETTRFEGRLVESDRLVLSGSLRCIFPSR